MPKKAIKSEHKLSISRVSLYSFAVFILVGFGSLKVLSQNQSQVDKTTQEIPQASEIPSPSETPTPIPTDTPTPTMTPSPTPNQELEKSIDDEKANVAKFEAEDKRLTDEFVGIADQLNKALAQRISSGGTSAGDVSSLLAQENYLGSLYKLNTRDLIAAKYRLAELELVRQRDFEGANRLEQDQQTADLENQQQEIVNKLDDILNKLK